jgi:hypothetical protein
VVFVSHCLLNENVRYPGGATVATTLAYRRLAGRVAAEIADYVRNGFEVVEVVGVGGSPSCGVATTLDLDRALAALACAAAPRDPRVTNRDVVTRNVVEGRGLFFAWLDRALRSRGIDITYREHDLVSELTDAGAVAP